jgi:outer membrane protein TolC
MGEVAQDVKRETGAQAVKIDSVEAAQKARERMAALLTEPLSSDAAVQVALLSNRDLQAAYNDLGISEADYVQQSLPPNPRLSFANFGGTGVADFELRLIQDILSLVTLPQRSKIAAEHFEHAKHGAVQTTLALAGDVRRAWVRTIAADRQIRFLDEARRTADESARLIAKLGEAGGGDQLEQTEIAAFYAELSVRVGQARLAARRQRETLTRLLGLWGGDVNFRLPDDLPPLPGEPDATADIETQAINRRVDLAMARHDVVALAKSLRLTQATRYVSMLQLAGLVNNENANPLTTSNTSITRGGGALELEIPIFDTGEARERKARETYMRAVNRLAAKAVNARSEARIASDAYRSTYDIARFYEKRLLPLRQVVSQQMALRYGSAVLANESMRVDYFRVLADQRARITANAAALDARRDFDLAAIDLQAALTFGLGPAEPSPVTTGN